MTGERIGKYEIFVPLGKSDSTFLVFDPDLQRHVVLKLYRQAVTPAQKEIVARAGEVLAQVRSPHVARCYGAELHDGIPFLVLEYIPGQNLPQRQRGRPMRIGAVLELMGQLAEGLAAVHACGLLHCDIKPANVIVGDDRVPRLMGFGLAAILATAAESSQADNLAYLAPEQARGEVEAIGPRTDLYGLGTVLYELLTGRPPHPETNPQELLAAAKAGEVPPPCRLNPKVPAAVSDLCLKCLAKDPAQRFGLATELSDALRNCRSWRRPWVYTVFAAAIIVVAWFAVDLITIWDGTTNLDKVGQLRHPDGRPLRRHFELQAQLPGVPQANGVYLLTEGDVVRLRLSVKRDCYVGVALVDGQGNVTMLFPNQDDQDHYLRKDQPRLIPPEDARDPFLAAAGPEPAYLHVFATTLYFEPITGQRVGPFERFSTPQERASFQEMLRNQGIIPDEHGLKVVPEEERGPEATRVSEMVISFKVRAKK